MTKYSAWINVSMMALAFAGIAGCALDTPPEDQPSKQVGEPAELDSAWQEVSPGVFLSDDGETRKWRIVGAEAHATFVPELLQRLDEAQESEEQRFYQNVLDGMEDSIEYASKNPDEISYKGRDTDVSITDLTNGLRATASASRGWGYVAAEVYVSVNDMSTNQRKSKSDTCISSCSVSVQKELTALFPPSSCRATAYAAAGGTSVYVERNSCPITCTPRTGCYAWECGWVANGCGGILYCGACPCVCGDGYCDPSGGEDAYNCPADCVGGCGNLPAGDGASSSEWDTDQIQCPIQY